MSRRQRRRDRKEEPAESIPTFFKLLDENKGETAPEVPESTPEDFDPKHTQHEGFESLVHKGISFVRNF